MRIYDTYLTGILAGHRPSLGMPWGFAVEAAASVSATCPMNLGNISVGTRTSDKQRSPGTQEVPL
jgi:hypothetical protein